METVVKVLIVDDQPVIRGSLRLRLTPLGCAVEEAENAAQGLELFERLRPRLVTLDVIMPTIGGYTSLDLMHDIRRIDPETNVVVISSKLDDREAFLNAGAIEFVAKPFDNFRSLARKLEPLIQSLSLAQ
jgi:two-component system chemotaxis response regulator CheY